MTERNYVVVRENAVQPLIVTAQGLDATVIFSEDRAWQIARELPASYKARVYACIPVGELQSLQDRLAATELREREAEQRAEEAGLAACAKYAEQFGALEIHDPEIDAMAAIAQALEPLDAQQRNRVLAWAADRFEQTKGMRLSVHGGTPAPTILTTHDIGGGL